MTEPSRRAHPRFAIEAAIEIRGPGFEITGRTKDVSRGGLAARLDKPIAPGTEVELAISLVFDEATFSEPLTLPARVVWCTPLGDDDHQLGTAFARMSPAQSEYLGMFLRYLHEANRTRARNDSAAAASDPGDPFSA